MSSSLYAHIKKMSSTELEALVNDANANPDEAAYAMRRLKKLQKRR